VCTNVALCDKSTDKPGEIFCANYVDRSNDELEHKEVVNEKTEKVIVDKELTNSVMQKFEDADKRRQQATSEEIQVLKDELEYIFHLALFIRLG
jgi:cation transport regulator ChaB